MNSGFTGLDFETYSDVSLPKAGLDRYINSPTFQPLIASIDDGQSPPVTFDFIFDGVDAQAAFLDRLHAEISWGRTLVAHNVGFERAVLKWMGAKDDLLKRMVDSAVVSRMVGAGSHLEAAAPQLTGVDKLETGKELIMLFSVPNEQNSWEAPTRKWIEHDLGRLKKWQDFKDYCEVDAAGSRRIIEEYRDMTSVELERLYEWDTHLMNQAGWPVDLELVHEMKRRYEYNVEKAEREFRELYDPKGELNFNSPMQLKAWCEARGIRAKSFDQEHTEKLLKALRKRLGTMQASDPKYDPLSEVEAMLVTKQELGGSSLKKLDVIINTVGSDGRLRNQYMHVGAGQTYRTSGRGVQMQNLKRLSGEVMDMENLYDETYEADNDELASNLRQLFRASQPGGELIVGDFSSVESRGLAWVAGADWKINAYRAGQDLYKVQAASIYGVPYESVTKDQRQTGKLGELSCGYGAGPVAVSRFAAKMGIEMGEEAALDLVRNWRSTNPETVALWDKIDGLIHLTVETGREATTSLAHGLLLSFTPVKTPESLSKQHPGAQTIVMSLKHGAAAETLILERTFQGCYTRGRNICYYKPSERKSGDLWSSHYRDPKTGQTRFYDVYGGKLAGILVQSLCREVFFYSLHGLTEDLSEVANATVIGQFHDEIVVDWWPIKPGTDEARRAVTLDQALALMETCMTTVPHWLKGFPLDADIKHDHRYTK